MRVLVVDDDLDQQILLRMLIEPWGHLVEVSSNGEDAIHLIEHFRPDVMITDLHMPRMGGFELMERLRTENSLPTTILLTSFGSTQAAIDTVYKHGGFWFLEKPVNTDALRFLLERAGESARLAAENERLRLELSQHGVLGSLVGRSPAMQEVFSLIRRVAPTNACVLVTGESGSGKELVARAIHANSQRAERAFLAVNCAAMPETLMESEVFGHEKGAFTGAAERRSGALELAEGGTLFLDEIGEMPMPMQAKWLRVLEDFQYRRLGGKHTLHADIRLICATNRPPAEAIREGKLREDLFYRLSVFHIEVPPLRNRIEEIPLIVESMLETMNAKHGTNVTHLSAEAAAVLMAQPWEGNVRELRNVIERAVILARQGPLDPPHLSVRSQTRRPLAPAVASGLAIRPGMTIDEAERILIQATLDQTSNNKTRAAALLGISAKTLHAKLRLYRMTGEHTQAKRA